MLSLFGHEKGIGQPIVVQVGLLFMVVTQALCRAGVERDNAGFMKLRFQDVLLRQIESQFDLIELQADGFADPQTGAGQQPKQTG